MMTITVGLEFSRKTFAGTQRYRVESMTADHTTAVLLTKKGTPRKRGSKYCWLTEALKGVLRTDPTYFCAGEMCS
jgi:hypothetical protein